MKIFTTGASGFVGINLVRRLVHTEHEVICLVRKTSYVDELKDLGVTLVYGDVTDKDSILEGMKGCDWVVNLANIYTLWEPKKQIYSDVNISGTRNVMESALDSSVNKVVHISTLAVWGKPSECPFNEDTPVGPVRFSEYARTKYAGDLVAWELYEKKKLPLVMLYLGVVLGAGDPKSTGQYFNNLIHQRTPARVFEDSALTYVYVADVAEATLKALEKENNIGEKYLIGKYRLSNREIAQMVSEISGVPLPKRSLPDSMALSYARMLTWIANLTKKPPHVGFSIDQARTMKEGCEFDGSKSEKELGIEYTPIRTAVEEAIASFR
jgi:dihydroflavonol-4-reductase